MKFQIDSLPKITGQYLISRGHEIERNTDWGNGRQEDREILLRAYTHGRTVITMDKDFGKLAFQDLVPHCGVIRIKPEIDAVALGLKIIQVMQDHFAHMAMGEVAVISEQEPRLSRSSSRQRFKRNANALTWQWPLR